MARILEPKKDEPIRLIKTKRYGPRYRCVVRVGRDRKQVTHTEPTLKEARAWVAATLAADHEGRFLRPSRATLRQVATQWLEARESTVGTESGIREVTLNGYRSALSGILMHIGDKPIQDITVADVRTLLTTLSTTGGVRGRALSHRSLVYALRTLRQVLAHAVGARYIDENPAQQVKPPNKKASDRGRVSVWTPAELAKFRDHVDAQCTGIAMQVEPWVRAGMRLTLCGLRRSEVLGLDWRHVDLDAGSVRIEQSRVKTGRGSKTVLDVAKSDDSHRTVAAEAIHPGTTSALRELWLAQGKPTEGLVIVNADGDPVHPDRYSRVFQSLRRTAGVRPMNSMHNVRHTIATTLHDRAIEPRKAASLLGHKVTTHLAFYVPTSDEGAALAARAAGEAFHSEAAG